jgi:hypothetical protein
MRRARSNRTRAAMASAETDREGFGFGVKLMRDQLVEDSRVQGRPSRLFDPLEQASIQRFHHNADDQHTRRPTQ